VTSTYALRATLDRDWLCNPSPEATNDVIRHLRRTVSSRGSNRRLIAMQDRAQETIGGLMRPTVSASSPPEIRIRAYASAFKVLERAPISTPRLLHPRNVSAGLAQILYPDKHPD
jgi:hypothetical protein